MRFFTSGEFALDSDPHNVVVASLSETGVVGFAALCGLLLATGSTLRRSRTPLAMAALAILVARVVHGTFDVYWVASTQTLPWLIVGMAVGEPVAEAAGDG
jgi:O-antigen ligase